VEETGTKTYGKTSEVRREQKEWKKGKPKKEREGGGKKMESKKVKTGPMFQERKKKITKQNGDKNYRGVNDWVAMIIGGGALGVTNEDSVGERRRGYTNKHGRVKSTTKRQTKGGERM